MWSTGMFLFVFLDTVIASVVVAVSVLAALVACVLVVAVVAVNLLFGRVLVEVARPPSWRGDKEGLAHVEFISGNKVLYKNKPLKFQQNTSSEEEATMYYDCVELR